MGITEHKKRKKGTSLVVQWIRITCKCRGHRFNPWSGKTAHASEQLSPCSTASEPARFNKRSPRAQSWHSTTGAVTAKRSLRAAAGEPQLSEPRESLHAATKTQSHQKENNFFLKYEGKNKLLGMKQGPKLVTAKNFLNLKREYQEQHDSKTFQR